MEVVLINKNGKELGTLERLEAHRRPGRLHKAISIVLYRPASSRQSGTSQGAIEILLQKRAGTKPLWPLYWANTVCTHPLPGETNLGCAVRRLREEVGINMKKQELKERYTFYYQADYNEVLSEHELDTVIVGEYKGGYSLNPEEAADAKWMGWTELKKDLEQNSKIYAPWPKYIFNDLRLLL